MRAKLTILLLLTAHILAVPTLPGQGTQSVDAVELASGMHRTTLSCCCMKLECQRPQRPQREAHQLQECRKQQNEPVGVAPGPIAGPKVAEQPSAEPSTNPQASTKPKEREKCTPAQCVKAGLFCTSFVAALGCIICV
jgi:hypothetical protein